MAKVISDEILKLKIVINGDEAQKRVLDLEKANKVLSVRLEDLKNKQKELSKQRKKDSEEYKANEQEIRRLTAAFEDNRRKIDEEIRSMDIMSLTIEQLTRRANDLRFAMNNMAPGRGLDSARDEYQRLNNRIRELRSGADGAGFSIRNLADKFNHYSGIAVAVAASLTGVAMSIQQTIDLNNKMADAQTAVAKTTGMTTDEVKDLTLAFSDFDTRTSKLDLLKISEIGGRLGVPKEEIKEFTREIDKAYVALGDSFAGGVEKVAEKLGKIKGLFKETKDLDIAVAVNQIGSALNELGAAGAASEENMSDFTLRIGQLPEALKPTVAETMALGGAFEESGIDAERASSGYSKFVRTAAKETAGFAQVMHISQDEVKKLINQDPLQFFLKFSEGAKGLDPVKLSEILDGLKLNDGEVISVIGAASENTDKFRKSIETSNQALKDATSLQQEFDKVNNNSAAIYEKVRKKFIGMFTSDAVAKTLNWIIQTMGKLLGVVEDTTGGATMFKESLLLLVKIITIATVGTISYNTALTLSELTFARVKEKLLAYTIVQEANNFKTKVGTFLTNTWNLTLGYATLAMARLTGSTTLQTAAQERLNLVTAANPYVAFFTVIMTIVTAYMLFRQGADEATKAVSKQTKEMQFQGEVSKKINDEEAKSAAELKSKIEPLIKVLKDKNSQLADRKKAYEELIKIAPEFKGTLDAEFMATSKLDAVYSSLIEKIKTAAKVRALQAILDEQFEKREKLAVKQEIFKTTQEKNKKDRSMLNPDGSPKPGIAFTNALVEKTNKDLDELDDHIDEITKKIADTNAVKPDATSNYTPLPDKEKKKKKTDAEKEAEKAENAYKRMRQGILDKQEDYDQKEIELEAQKQAALAEKQKDGYAKERAVIEAEKDKRLADLEKQKYRESDFEAIDEIISREKGNLKKRFQTIREQWVRENKLIEDTKQAEKDKANFKLLQLDDKYLMEDYKQKEAAFEKSLKLLNREQNQTIADTDTVKKQKEFLASKGYSEESLRLITTWEEGKAKIEQYYQAQSLEKQVTYLQEQVDMFNVMAASMPDLLTDDQLEKIQEYKDKIAALLAEITKLKSGKADEGKKGLGSLSSFGGNNTDIFGLTPTQWEAMFANTDSLAGKMQKVGAAVQVMQNMFSTYSSFVQANEQKMLQKMEVASERKKKRLKNQLDTGIITQEEYKKQTILIDSELDKKKAELEYKQAKRQRAIQMAQAITGTAMAIINAANTQPFFPLGLAMMVLAGAAGAVQIATIASTPLPSATGAEDGFYPVLRQQDSKLFNARKRQSKTGIYDEPTMLVGEAGPTMPELVVSGKTMKRIDPTIQKIYMNEIRRVEGFENGLYPTQVTSSGSDELLIKAMDIMKENTELMRDLRNNGIKGYFVKSARLGKDITEMQDQYTELRNKNKH